MNETYEKLFDLLKKPELSIEKSDDVVYQEGPVGYYRFVKDSRSGCVGSLGCTGPTGPMGCLPSTVTIPSILSYTYYTPNMISCDDVCCERKKQIFASFQKTKGSSISITYHSLYTDTGVLKEISDLINILYQNGEKLACNQFNVNKVRTGLLEEFTEEVNNINSQNDEINRKHEEKEAILRERSAAFENEISDIGGCFEDYDIYIPRPTLVRIPDEYYSYEYKAVYTVSYLPDTLFSLFVETL